MSQWSVLIHAPLKVKTELRDVDREHGIRARPPPETARSAVLRQVLRGTDGHGHAACTRIDDIRRVAGNVDQRPHAHCPRRCVQPRLQSLSRVIIRKSVSGSMVVIRRVRG